LFCFFYQKTRLERANSTGHYPGDETDNYVGSSAATTVVRKTAQPNRPSASGTPKSFDDSQHSNLLTEQNHKVFTNKHTLDQQHHRASMRQTASKTSSDPFQTSYSGQQILLTSGDIEAMTMKQFRIGSLGC